MQHHLNGRIFENQRRGFHQDGLPGSQFPNEDVSGSVQQQETRRLRGAEAVHHLTEGVMRFGVVAASRLKPNVGLKPVVMDIAGGGQEQVLANVNGLPRLQRQRDQLARSILRKSDMSWTLCLRHDERQAAHQAFPCAFQRHRRDSYLRIFPQQHVVREVDRVFRRQFHVGDRNVHPFDLADGFAKVQLRHILPARKFGPARVGWPRSHPRCRSALRAVLLAGVDDRSTPSAFAGRV